MVDIGCLATECKGMTGEELTGDKGLTWEQGQLVKGVDGCV